MQDSLTADRPVQALLRMAARRLRNLHRIRTARIIPVTRMLRDILRVAMDPIMDSGMVLDMAIVMDIVLDIAVGLAENLFPVECPDSNAEAQFQSRCGFNRWSIIFPSLESQKGNT